MAQRYNGGSHFENHQRAAEMHELAAHALRTAAEEQGKQDHQTGQEHSRQALEHSQLAFETTQGRKYEMSEFGHAKIAALAYELWQTKGCPADSSAGDWSEAIAQLRIRFSEQGAR
jgi:hypothetical protein